MGELVINMKHNPIHPMLVIFINKLFHHAATLRYFSSSISFNISQQQWEKQHGTSSRRIVVDDVNQQTSSLGCVGEEKEKV